MATQKDVALTTRVDSRIKAMADKWCKSKGLVMARFIEDAILDKLEEAFDAQEIQHLRRESVRPFDEVLKELSFKD